MIGMGVRHPNPLVNLFKEGNKVNAAEETNKPTASEWLVDSGALVHITNCKEDLTKQETISQAVTTGSGKMMAAQFKGARATVLTDMVSGNILELEDTLFIPNFKKKIVSLSNLLDQGYKVDEWNKTHLKKNKAITIKWKENQLMFYLLGF